MVNIKEDHQPYYQLDTIRQAAQKDSFRYDGRKVNRDIRNLGYTSNDVKRFISQLVKGQFQKTIEYDSHVTYDVYISDYQKHEDAPIDEIYLKLRLLPDGELQIVGIDSFHLA